jgi:hypothetical protein
LIEAYNFGVCCPEKSRKVLLREEQKMKKLVFSMMLVAIAMFGVARAAEVGVGNPNYDNGWSTTEAVTATGSGAQYSLVPTYTIDGSGLDGDTGTMHGIDWNTFWDAPTLGGQTTPHPGTVSCLNWLAFEFDKAYPLTVAHIWNDNFEAYWRTASGAKDITVQYSLTGGSDPAEWSTLGTFEAVRGTGEPNFSGNDLCNFRGKMAKYVCFSAMSMWAGVVTDTAIAEVRFYYTDDPCNYVPPAGWELTMQTNPSFVTTITPAIGTYTLDAGVIQNISAAPFINCPDTYTFSHWTGDGIADPTSANTTVTMTADRTVTAVYVLNNQCGDTCHLISAYDLSKDCMIDFKDFALLASEWLQCTKVVCP